MCYVAIVRRDNVTNKEKIFFRKGSYPFHSGGMYAKNTGKAIFSKFDENRTTVIMVWGKYRLLYSFTVEVSGQRQSYVDSGRWFFYTA
jgi:hypothetical protein